MLQKTVLLLCSFFSLTIFAVEFVAVLEISGSVTKDESKILTDKVITLIDKAGDYRIIERSMMKQILAEQEFQKLDCVSGECAVDVGQILGVEKIITGSIGKIGPLYSISLRKINVETGEIEGGASYEINGGIEDVLTVGLAKCVEQLTGSNLNIVEIKKVKTKAEKNKTTFTILSATGTVLSAGATAYFYWDMTEKQKIYNNTTLGDFETPWENLKTSETLTYVSGGATLAFTGLAIFIATREIKISKDEKISITPLISSSFASLHFNYNF